MVGHAGELGPFDGDFAIVGAGDQEAIDPVDGVITGDNAEAKIGGAEAVGDGVGAGAEFVASGAVDGLENQKEPILSTTSLP